MLFMEDILMNGENNAQDAEFDNSIVTDLNDDLADDLKDVYTSNNKSDFNAAYNDIQQLLNRASENYTFTDFSLVDELSDVLDDIVECYSHSKFTKDDVRAYKYDKGTIKGYLNFYSCNHSPYSFLDI